MSRFAVFKCTLVEDYNDQNKVLDSVVEISAEDIISIKPVAANVCIVNYYNTDFCINESIFCKDIFVENIEI
jgi:hypothetical protein